MSKKTTVTNSVCQTKQLGAHLAQRVLEKGPRSKAWVFGLRGDLGSGKTSFVQGFAKGLGVEAPVKSPTYTIVKRFPVPAGCRAEPCLRFANLYHIDCYRLQKAEELLALGFKKVCSVPANIVLVVWPEKIEKILPDNTLFVRFEHLSSSRRRLTLPF